MTMNMKVLFLTGLDAFSLSQNLSASSLKKYAWHLLFGEKNLVKQKCEVKLHLLA